METLEIIYLISEWIFAAFAIILHKKIKEKGSFLLAAGLTLTAALWVLELVGKYLAITNITFSYIIPGLMLVVHFITLAGFGLLVFNWEKIKNKNI